MLIVEDGTGLPDANSYASLEYAARYFGLQGNDTWFGGSPTAATGVLTFASIPNDGDTVTLGDVVYKFVATLSDPAVANEVVIGDSDIDARDHLIAAINQESGRGTTYSAPTVRNYWARASVDGPASIEATAVAPGPTGSDITTSATGQVSWENATLVGGSQNISQQEQENALITATAYIDARFSTRFRGWPVSADQALAFPRTGIAAGCSQGKSMPPRLLSATVEYAVRALAGPLAPDPVSDPSGYAIRRRRRKLGPIENEWEFATGENGASGPSLWKSYPIPDALLSCMVSSMGANQSRVIRS